MIKVSQLYKEIIAVATVALWIGIMEDSSVVTIAFIYWKKRILRVNCIVC